MSVTNLCRSKGVSTCEQLKINNSTNNYAQDRSTDMKKLLLGGFLVAAVLATAGFAATRASTTEASETTPVTQTAPAIERGITAQQADADETTAKPYIGISIRNAPEDGGTDGALVVSVVEGSPADGRLQVDDIITAIDDTAVSGARDVVGIVHESAPGDSIIFSVSRGGSATDISITVGELPADGHPHANRRHGHMGMRAHGYGHGHMGNMGMGNGMRGGVSASLITSESRYLTDDGVKTVLKAAGTTQNIDATAGTFDLLLRDESETLSFTVNDDTKIFVQGVEGAANIADLSADTDTTTMVMQVTSEDGTQQVHFVVQGNFAKHRMHRHRSNGK